MPTAIRPARKADLPHLKNILNTIELFPAEYLEPMMADYFDNPETEHLWFTAEQNGEAVGFGYCAPMELAEGTQNLYAIGVRDDLQGQGIGGQMMTYLEGQLRDLGHRILIVETSGTDDFKLTRKFYTGRGYDREAVIRDFWADGDDKVVFRKRIN